ncbi:MAG TPA: hypothetical protein ENI23_17730 [bacterium]|nr:hypothetical protein [bacterium]
MIKVHDRVILDLAGGTGAWSKPYKEQGYTVYNITLPEYDILETDFLQNSFCFHHESNKHKTIYIAYKDIYGILAAPPCTMFSFARTTAKAPRDLRKGMEIVIACLRIIWECQYGIKKDVTRISPLRFWVIENPDTILNWFLGCPAFVFDPCEFGDGYKKKTALWGHFNSPEKQVFFKFEKQKKFEDKRVEELRKIHKTRIKGKTELRSITPAGFSRAFYEANK